MTQPSVITTKSPSVPMCVGALIVNADDWGLDCTTTDRTLECIRHGVISSASAMVFMKDSERAAAIARQLCLDVGLHLNFTAPFTAANVTPTLSAHQRRVSRHLLRNRYAKTIFHPGLMRSFEYSVQAQLAEFVRLYGAPPARIDGHHHMHLSSNVLVGRLLPAGTVVRRNFSFAPGEKSLLNRMYRSLVDRALKRRHLLADFFFSLPPLDPPERLQKIFSLARDFVVELETHPVRPDEYRFLAKGEVFRLASGIPVAPRYTVRH